MSQSKGRERGAVGGQGGKRTESKSRVVVLTVIGAKSYTFTLGFVIMAALRN